MAAFSYTDSLKTVAATSTVPFTTEDVTAMLTALAAIDGLVPTVALAAGILTATLSDTRVMSCTVGSTTGIATGVGDGVTYVLTAAGNGTGIYTGTIVATANVLAGKRVVIEGFVETANNGTFTITANNATTTMTTSNLASVTETHAGTAAVTSTTLDRWTPSELTKMIAFMESAIRVIRSYTATVFTVTYA